MRTAFPLLVLAAACGGHHATTPANHASGGGDGLVATITPFDGTAPAGEDLGDATVHTPVVDVPGNPAASAAINDALGVPNTAAALAEIKELGEVGLSYEVGFNRRGVLDLTIDHETMGAYPDGYATHFLFDLATGKKLTGADLLTADGRAALAASLDKQLQAELDAARTDPDNADCLNAGEDLYQGTFTPELLEDVGVTDAGLRFAYPYDFPHVVAACEPAGTFTVPWAEVAPYLIGGTAVAKLAR